MAVAVIDEPRRSLWQSLGEAIKGSHQDFTEGSISRAVLLLATPMVLEMCMESLFAIVDVFWVARLGANALTTVALTESMLTLVFSVALGVSLSTTAMVARRVGEKDGHGAAVAATQAIFLGIAVALCMGVPGAVMAPQLLKWMGAAPDLIATGHTYTRIVFGGSISVLLLFLNNAIFRGAGDAAIAMRVLWFANLINLLLDPCFIFGLGPFPRLGVTGAAVSTLIGRSCGVLYQLWILTNARSRLAVAWRDWRVVPKVIGTLARVSVTGVLQFAVAHTSWIFLVRIISLFGSLAVAGYSIGIRIVIFAILPSWGLSGAAATMMGQNLGAKKPERAERAVYLTGFYNMIVLGIVAAAFITIPHVIVGIFTKDPAITSYGTTCLRVIAYGNLAYAYGMVMIQAFNGAGDTVTPTIISVIGFWCCELPLAWTLAFPMHWGVKGVFASIPIAEAVMTAMSATMFLRGGWKRTKI